MIGRRRIGPVISVVVGLAALTAIAAWAHRRAVAIRDTWPKVEEHVWVPQPAAARFISLGYNEAWADVFWVKTLLYYGGGTLEDSSLADVEPLVALVNAFDPTFRRPYMWGALASVFRQREATQAEYRASAEILERGLKAFPDDWELAWLLGIRDFFDIKSDDPVEQERLRDTGAGLVEHAMHMKGASHDLPLLAASMRGRLGQRLRALRELREMILTTEDPEARKTLELRYASLASEDATQDLHAAAEALDAEWAANLPMAPRSLYVFLGPRPKGVFDLPTLAQGGEEMLFAGPPP